MTFQARQFLGDINPIREQGHFFKHAFIVQFQVQTGLIESIQQRFPMPAHSFGCLTFHSLDRFLQRINALLQILLQIGPFAGAHRQQFFKSRTHGRAQGRPQGFHIQLFLRSLQDARRAQDSIQTHLAAELQIRRQLAVFLGILISQITIDLHLCAFAALSRPLHPRRNPSPRYLGVDLIPSATFQSVKFPWQIQRQLRLLTVHRADFHGKFRSTPRRFAAAIAGHGIHRAVNVPEIDCL